MWKLLCRHQKINFHNLVNNMHSLLCPSRIKYEEYTSKEVQDFICFDYILFCQTKI